MLVLVGDRGPSLSRTATHRCKASGGRSWLHNAAYINILPVLPQDTDVPTKLPAGLKELNVSLWSRDISESIHDILYVAGLDRARRLFISYIRKDSTPLAEQLFEELTKRSFEVFLDRFGVPPGADFQAQLTEELADKSMVLVLGAHPLLL